MDTVSQTRPVVIVPVPTNISAQRTTRIELRDLY